MNYEYLRALYESDDDYSLDDSAKTIEPSNTEVKVANIDIFDQFSELDFEDTSALSFLKEIETVQSELEVTTIIPETKELEVTNVTPEIAKEEYLSFQDKKDILTSMFDELDEKEMNDTKRIQFVGLNGIIGIEPGVDKIYNGERLEVPEKPKRRFLPWSIVESHHLQAAFVDCAILGFITAAFGYGMLYFIINNI